MNAPPVYPSFRSWVILLAFAVTMAVVVAIFVLAARQRWVFILPALAWLALSQYFALRLGQYLGEYDRSRRVSK